MSYQRKSSNNKGLPNPHLTDDQQDEVSNLHLKERRVVSFVLLLVIGFAVQDFIEDLSDGGGWVMVITDVVYVSIMMGLLIYIWRNVPQAHNRESHFLTQAMQQQREDAEAWKAQAAELLAGLGQMINAQLLNWQLSEAEREVAVYLLKGFSLKDIAGLRGTGERTVRQQATHVYTKAGLSGRAELSAFFLEDLLPARSQQ